MNRYVPMLAIPLLASAVPAFAASVVPESWTPVSDDVLSHATGKYAQQNMITGFQLVMQSQWQMPTGASLMATGVLDVSQNGSGYQVRTGASTGIIPGLANAARPLTQTVAGPTSVLVNGVAQITQVAGDANNALNKAVIQFAPGISITALVPASGQGTNSSQTTLGNLNASVAISSAGMQISLNTPNGNLGQSVAGGAGAAMNQIMQVVQVAGNAQQVMNTMQLNLQTGPLTSAGLRQAGVQSALANVIGIRR
ncbi:peptidase C39 [Pandoraea sp. CB10b_02]|uniref:peptidase C39 n=1 Tax=Pandoraea sp. CB10b_02 TaxID=2014535 RepID=UPI00257D4F8B|nr:peptidase C39 [Pandoraea sp. CB10b_02]